MGEAMQCYRALDAVGVVLVGQHDILSTINKVSWPQEQHAMLTLLVRQLDVTLPP